MTLENKGSQLELPLTSIATPPDRELELPSQALSQMSPALQVVAQMKPASRALAQMMASLNRELELSSRALSQMMASLNRELELPLQVLSPQNRMLKLLTPQILETLTPHIQRDSTLYTVGRVDGIYMPEQDDEHAMSQLFISHSSEDECLATEISAELLHLGIASFVAHRDIEPMADWWSVLVHALDTVDGLVALLTSRFKSSDWTDHEVGAVLSRGLPIITVQLGVEPYGLMSRWQAIQGSNKTPRVIANKIRDAFIKSKRPRQTHTHPTWV